MAGPDYAPLIYWVRERENIRLRRAAGEDYPWTGDAILHAWRFCNVRREDDKVTVWIKENIRQPFADHPNLWFMLCLARWINLPDTLAELIAHSHAWPIDETWDPKDLTAALDARQRRGDTVYTGAYTINAPPKKGTTKNQHVAEVVLGDVWRRREILGDWFAREPRFKSLREAVGLLMKSPGWGDFMAYQAVVDMRFTKLLEGVEDVASWATAGPGTMRGLNWLRGRPVEPKIPQEQALSEMRAIYRVVPDVAGVAMDFSDVPNILCETDKYLRVEHERGKPRQKYAPAA